VRDALPLSYAACFFSIFVQRLDFVLEAPEGYDIDLGTVRHETLRPVSDTTLDLAREIKHALEIM
jgi:hypothetical protein